MNNRSWNEKWKKWIRVFRTANNIFCRFSRQMGCAIAQFIFFFSFGQIEVQDKPAPRVNYLHYRISRYSIGSLLFFFVYVCSVPHSIRFQTVDNIVNGGTYAVYASPYRCLSSSKIIQSWIQLLIFSTIQLLRRSSTIICRESTKSDIATDIGEYSIEIKIKNARRFVFEWTYAHVSGACSAYAYEKKCRVEFYDVSAFYGNSY